MHISEGVLSGPTLLGGWVLAAVGVAVGLKRIDYDRVMTVAMLAAAFFVASLVHVPVGPASVHLILNGLLGIILGWAAFPAILAGLALQALFFQFGGLAVLGVNTVTMAGPAVLMHYCCRPWLRRSGAARPVAAFVAGAGAVLFSGLLLAVAMGVSDKGFLGAARLVVLAHLPVMAIEGLVTMFAVSFLARVQPEMLGLTFESPSPVPAPAEPH